MKLKSQIAVCLTLVLALTLVPFASQARYLNPSTGRFWTMDTYEGNNSDPLSLHKYLYAHADPINGIDPSGHSFILEFSIANAKRGAIAGFTLGAINAGWTYAKTRSASAAIRSGLLTSATVGMSFVSPLAAWTFGTAGVGMLGYGVASGDITADDLPEIATYVVAGVILHATLPGKLDGSVYAQKTYRPKFSKEGRAELSKITGRQINTVDDLVQAIKDGVVKVDDIPVNYIVRDGNTIILNTRTSMALEKAGIPKSQWKGSNRTGDEFWESLLDGQLKRNNLDNSGTTTVMPE